MKYDIFISYRREGGYDTAKHLYDLLARDGYRVSFDIDTLRSGDFDTQLYYRIDQCTDFILIIDQHAFDRTIDCNFDPKKDWLRCELAYALKKNKNIIPVFLSGVSNFPDNLPIDVVEVTKKNSPEYNRYHFNAFYDDLKKRFIQSSSLKSVLKRTIFIISIVCGIVALYVLKPWKTTPPNFPNFIISNPPEVEFYAKKSEDFEPFANELFAKVDGYDYRIELPDDICFEIVEQEDFDGDDITEALIEDIQACGGNAIGDSFFFVCYSGGGYFSISNSFGINVWETPIIETWNGTKSVVIFDTNEGLNQDKDYLVKERYILRQGKAVRVESSKKNYIVAQKEILSSDFHNGKENDTICMSCDLDGNGLEDYINCTYWDRWDIMNFEIIFNGDVLKCPEMGVSRIGVLSSKTNGMHDLIYNEDDVVKWDGKKYVLK